MAKDPLQEIAADLRDTRVRVGSIELHLQKLDLHAQKTDIDVAQIQQTLLRHEARFDALDLRMDAGFAEMDAGFAQMREGFSEIRSISKGLTGAVTEAISQLSVSRSFEKRLDRLEDAVFGSKT